MGDLRTCKHQLLAPVDSPMPTDRLIELGEAIVARYVTPDHAEDRAALKQWL